jgi:hypothetical protein
MNNQRLKRIKRIVCVLLAVLLLTPPALAAETVDGIGQLLRKSTLPIGQDTYYTTDTLQHTVSGKEEERYIEFTPGGGLSPVVAYGSKLYGKSNVNEVANYLRTQGMTPVAAVNGDFFMTDTGIPIGLVITDGIIRSSDSGQNAVCFREDGSAFISKPQLSVNLNAGGQDITIEYVNKTRKYYGLSVYGWAEEIVSGKTPISRWGWHITEIRDALDAVASFINAFDTSSAFDVPASGWTAITAGRPRADIMREIRDLILTL